MVWLQGTRFTHVAMLPRSCLYLMVTATAAFVLNGRGQGCRKSTCSYKMEVS
jgi:hypothetical protein